ncbi:hypothetical protein J4429_00635 [Candidatus Pacearchaeota archaeon]|nr:hypothetical protein [Candidatus Pacearchaeota archaeon]
MSLDTTATSEGDSMTREAEAAYEFISLYHTKGHIEALSFHASLSPEIKDYVQYSSISQKDFAKAREEIERSLKC